MFNSSLRHGIFPDELIRQLNISKGAGLDKIPAKMLRIAAAIIASSLTYIFNLSLSTDARVILIYKEGERRNLGVVLLLLYGVKFIQDGGIIYAKR